MTMGSKKEPQEKVPGSDSKEKHIEKLLNYKVLQKQIQKKSERLSSAEKRQRGLSTKLQKPDQATVKRLMAEEPDERYKYLLKHGVIHFIETQNSSLYVGIPQIPNIMIVYRRPGERKKFPETFNLGQRGLKHIPLLEGEEGIKELVFRGNKIMRIENLVSLPVLESLDVS